MVYEWGSKRYPVDPNVAAAEVSRIAADHDGAALAAAIVEESRAPDAPLHPAVFRESDEEAAEARRREVARSLVASLVVVTEDDKGTTHKAPAFYHVAFRRGEEEPVQGYQSRDVVMADIDSRESAEALLLKQLQGLRRRYDGLQPFERVWHEVDRIGSELEVAA